MTRGTSHRLPLTPHAPQNGMTEEGYVERVVDARGIATITFGHPSHNALPSNLLAELSTSIHSASADRSVRLLLLKSAGDRTFCAGASFDELLQIKTPEQGFAFFSGFANVINACRTASCLTVCRVQGKAVGGGVGLAAAADYSIASPYASVRLSELGIGIGPFVVGPAIERKVGGSILSKWTLEPTEFQSAEAAHDAGLFARIVDDPAKLDAAVESKLEELAGYSREAMTAIKESLWHGTEDWDQLLAARARMSGELVLTRVAQEALRAFKERSGSS